MTAWQHQRRTGKRGGVGDAPGTDVEHRHDRQDAAPGAQGEHIGQRDRVGMDHRGAVQGRVTNASGAAVADAAVVAVNEENGAQFTANTDAQGAYAFAALPVGKYTVSIATAGVTTFSQSPGFSSGRMRTITMPSFSTTAAPVSGLARISRPFVVG